MRLSLIKIAIGVLALVLGFLPYGIPYINFAIFFAGYLVLGVQVLARAFKNIFKKDFFDENLLMSVASIGAFILGNYAEGLAVMLFYQVGELFNEFAMSKSQSTIEKALDIRPDYAHLIVDGRPQKTNPENVKPGDLIMVKLGERFPMDVIVKDGVSTVDASALTGESTPITIKPGSKVLSGCINLKGTIVAQVKSTYQESTVSKILELVKNTESRKAQTEDFITKFSKYYTPIVIALAIILAVVPPVFIPGATFTQWFYRALVFLVISCPCALLISVPLSFFCGIGAASKKGILIKGGKYIEYLAMLTHVIFDKTGTLTEGKFTISKIHTVAMDRDEFLEIASYAEIHSPHPIAMSIKDRYNKKLDETRVKDVQNFTGYGIRAKVDGKIVHLGNKRLMDRLGILCESPSCRGSVVHMSVDREYAGYVVICDKIKVDSLSAIKQLYKIGIQEVAMFTGDSRSIADSVAHDLGIEYCRSELLPEDKVEELEKLVKKNDYKGTFAFVGDGINDAPVISSADVGIAMGALGADAAVETADVVIMNDRPTKVTEAISTSKKTMKIAKQNIVLSLTVKFAILFLGAVGMSNMWWAVFSDVGVSVLVILNSLRIIKSLGE